MYCDCCFLSRAAVGALCYFSLPNSSPTVCRLPLADAAFTCDDHPSPNSVRNVSSCKYELTVMTATADTRSRNLYKKLTQVSCDACSGKFFYTYLREIELRSVRCVKLVQEKTCTRKHVVRASFLCKTTSFLERVSMLAKKAYNAIHHVPQNRDPSFFFYNFSTFVHNNEKTNL